MHKETIIIFLLSVILSIIVGITTMTFEEMLYLWALFFVTGGLSYFIILSSKPNSSNLNKESIQLEQHKNNKSILMQEDKK